MLAGLHVAHCLFTFFIEDGFENGSEIVNPITCDCVFDELLKLAVEDVDNQRIQKEPFRHNALVLGKIIDLKVFEQLVHGNGFGFNELQYIIQGQLALAVQDFREPVF